MSIDNCIRHTCLEISCNLSGLNQTEVFSCLENILGPQRMKNRSILLLVTSLYLLLFLCGVIGNLLVCIVIIRSKELHTAMNFYLVSLAVADMTMVITGKSFSFINCIIWTSFAIIMKIMSLCVCHQACQMSWKFTGTNIRIHSRKDFANSAPSYLKGERRL